MVLVCEEYTLVARVLEEVPQLVIVPVPRGRQVNAQQARISILPTQAEQKPGGSFCMIFLPSSTCPFQQSIATCIFVPWEALTFYFLLAALGKERESQPHWPVP